MTEATRSPVAEALIDLCEVTPPAAALEMMRLSILDWASVALAGSDEPVSGIVRAVALSEAGLPEAHVIGSQTRLPARAAALVNGTLSHALDYDDTHFAHIGHPSVAILPAAFAIGEARGLTLRAVIEAALLGVEASCRIGIYLGRSHYQHGFHQTATAGTFGATLAAARLLGLDRARMAAALGLAATRASGLKSQFGTMGKPYHAGMAASNGVEVARLAAAGFISRPDGIDCAQGFAPTHAGDGNFEAAFAHRGGRFTFEDIRHKFHACCHGTHAALEAIEQLRQRLPCGPSDIEAVEIRVHPRWLSVCDIAAPTSGLEAKFSYRLTAAAALSGHDTGALATFSEALCTAPDLVRLRDLVRVTGDETLTETAARVSVLCGSGTTLEEAHDIDQTLPLATLSVKILSKSAALIGESRARAIAGRLAEDARAPDERPVDLAWLIGD